MAFWPFVFVRRKEAVYTINHEVVHCKQQLELLIVPFYLLYVIFHFVYGYWDNPFEVEGWAHREKPDTRKPYGWIKYL